MTNQAFSYFNQAKIGDVISSILTEAQIQSERDTTWVLMDGRDITGSDLATLSGITALPDARGQFLRGKNNGRSDGNQDPDGERAIGNSQSDAIRNITGTIGLSPAHGFTGSMYEGAFEGGTGRGYTLSGVMQSGQNGSDGIFNASNSVPTADDNRPKNIAVNYFIKINR